MFLWKLLFFLLKLNARSMFGLKGLKTTEGCVLEKHFVPFAGRYLISNLSWQVLLRNRQRKINNSTVVSLSVSNYSPYLLRWVKNTKFSELLLMKIYWVLSIKWFSENYLIHVISKKKRNHFRHCLVWNKSSWLFTCMRSRNEVDFYFKCWIILLIVWTCNYYKLLGWGGQG